MKLADLEKLEHLRKQAEGASFRQAHTRRETVQRYADHLVFWGEELMALARPTLEASDCLECGGRGYLWYVGKDEDPMDGARQHKCHACDGSGKPARAKRD